MARCRYYKMCWLRLGYDYEEWNSDCQGGGDAKCKHFEPMPNVSALSKMAKEMSEITGLTVQIDCYKSITRYISEDLFRAYADRIRKVLGNGTR